MNRNYSRWIAVLLLGMVYVSCSCGSDETSEFDVPHQEIVGWNHAKVKLNIECVDFDQQVKSTRSTSSCWQDGDVVYLLLTDKDGNKVKAHVRYDGNKQVWGDVMYEGYTNNLICTAQRSVEAYFIDGINSVEDEDMVFDAASSVYACYDGTYIYPLGKDMEIEVVLKPITSRIRFVGENGTEFSVDGMKFYNSFSRSTGQLGQNTGSITTTIGDDGSSPYVYGMFADPINPSLSITHSGCTFLTEFLSDTPVLAIGRSGKFKLPTRNMNNGWNVRVHVNTLTLNKTSTIIEKGESENLIATILPKDATNKQIRWTSSSPNVATVSDSGSVTAIECGSTIITGISVSDENVKASCMVKVLDTNGHAYVDLDLTSGTLWATMNVGAITSSDYGDYIAWGEISGYNGGKTSFSWSNYKWCNGSATTLTKYCTDSSYGKVDYKRELEIDDDAALANWGGAWKIPTSTQFIELYNECTWTWTTQDGYKGYKVTSKKNGNSIFMPAAGYRNTSLSYSESQGHYWSSSLYQTNSKVAYVLCFNSSHIYPSDHDYRAYGESLRPVLNNKE